VIPWNVKTGGREDAMWGAAVKRMMSIEWHYSLLQQQLNEF
jgi:hypothetical protein